MIGAGQTHGASGMTWDNSNFCLIIPGKESGENLILPAAGYRNNSAGASDGQGVSGLYWSSSVSPASAYAGYVYFNSAGDLETNTSDRANGYSVRCIQE